jgi:3-deoxy-7-phosphoheptulonate synthase
MRFAIFPQEQPDPAATRIPALEPGVCAAKQLPAPAALEERYPLDDEGAEHVAKTRREIAAIFAGLDDRLVVVVGPCSVHDPAAALDYADRLAGAALTHAGDLLVVMRVYFEKPRTVAGWKGFVNDTRLDGSFEINEGLYRARELLVEITRLGLAAGTEFLDTILGQFYADLVSWGVIGARTVESQIHRELASGLSMPVGFKNRTDGNYLVAVDAVRAARSAHRFPVLDRDGTPTTKVSSGNDSTHIVLRGGTGGPNFSATDVRSAATVLRKHGLSPHLMVDCSHANSGKDPTRQPTVASALAAQIRAGERAIAGVMLESNLVGGAQSLAKKPLVYGQSITDGCLAWEATVPVLAELALAVRARRQLRDAPCADRGAATGRPESLDASHAAKAVPSDSPQIRNPPRLRVLVADDEPLARARLLALLPNDVDIVGAYGTGTEALDAMRRDKPDIAFLDMQMPGCNGLQAVADLEPSERPAVVFVTAHEKFAVEAFDIRAVDYVLKPFDRQRLATALERAAEFVHARRARGQEARVKGADGANAAIGQPEPPGGFDPSGRDPGRRVVD